MTISETEKWGLIIPIFLMLISYVYTGIEYNKNKNYNKIFTNVIVPFLIIAWTTYSGLAHIFISKSITKSIGWNEDVHGFQREVGMFQVSIAILGIYYIIKKNIKALVAISYIWVLFIIQATLLHLKEILFDKNYELNSIRPTVTGTLNIIFICFIISKLDLEKWE